MKHERSLFKRERWKPSQKTYLRKHCRDGSEAIALALGKSKTAVEIMASRMGLSLSRQPWRPGSLCPRCGTHELEPGGPGWAEGLCPPCHWEVLAERSERRAAEIEARRAYDRARDHVRAAKGGGDAQAVP